MGYPTSEERASATLTDAHPSSSPEDKYLHLPLWPFALLLGSLLCCLLPRQYYNKMCSTPDQDRRLSYTQLSKRKAEAPTNPAMAKLMTSGDNFTSVDSTTPCFGGREEE